MFGQTTHKRWFCENSVQREAINRLLYLIEARAPFGLLTGIDGSGRSTVLEHLREELLSQGIEVVSLNLTGLDELTVLRLLSSAVGSPSNAEQTRSLLICALRDELIGRADCGLQTVLLLDDLHRSGTSLQPLLRFLCELNSGSKGGVSTIVASERAAIVGELASGLVHIHLTPLSDLETSQFAKSRFRHQASGRRDLGGSALSAVCASAAGSPGRISRICDLLAVVGETHPDAEIDEIVVQSVIQELLAAG